MRHSANDFAWNFSFNTLNNTMKHVREAQKIKKLTRNSPALRRRALYKTSITNMLNHMLKKIFFFPKLFYQWGNKNFTGSPLENNNKENILE